MNLKFQSALRYFLCERRNRLTTEYRLRNACSRSWQENWIVEVDDVLGKTGNGASPVRLFRASRRDLASARG